MHPPTGEGYETQLVELNAYRITLGDRGRNGSSNRPLYRPQFCVRCRGGNLGGMHQRQCIEKNQDERNWANENAVPQGHSHYYQSVGFFGLFCFVFLRGGVWAALHVLL